MRMFFKSLIKSVAAALKRNRRFANFFYNIRNADEFSDLYEHEKMLADSIRVESYYGGITRYVKEGDVVVDLGTGTGLLAFFAAQNNPAQIYAIDHSDFIEVAKIIARHNNFSIQFIKTHSGKFLPSEKVDVIIHEQIGDDLFNENMVENILQLKKRVLKDSGVIIPGKFEVFLEPVVLKEGFRVPFVWDNTIHGIDFNCMRNIPEICRYQRNDYLVKDIESSAIDYFMCQPEPIFTFDLNTMSGSDDLPKSVVATRKVKRSGTIDGLLFFFRVIFDDDYCFDTSPFSSNTHWGNFIFRLDRKEFLADEVIAYELNMNNLIDRRSWVARLLQKSPAAT